MHRYVKHCCLALATATLAWGCATSTAPEANATAEAQRDALVQRALVYRDEARKAPQQLTPERKAELTQLARDVRAWQARTGRNDIRVTDQRVTAAQRSNDGGGPGNCESDCPVYTFQNDEICFLNGSECSSDPDSHGTICIYSCISIASNVAPERNSGQ